jgi:hypothetical protein
MMTRSAHLDHKNQLPLGMDQAGTEIVNLIKSIWKICDGCMKYDSRERFTFAQIADKMEDLNVKAPGTAPSAPPISEISNGNRYVNGAFSSS